MESKKRRTNTSSGYPFHTDAGSGIGDSGAKGVGADPYHSYVYSYHANVFILTWHRCTILY